MAVSPESSNDPNSTTTTEPARRQRVARQLPRIAAVGAAIIAMVVAGWVLIGDLKPDEAVVGTLVGVAALVLFVSAFASAEWLEAVLGRVKGVKVAGFELQLDAFQKVAKETPETSDGEPAIARTLLDLKVNLENKLTYIANNVINADKGSDPIQGFVTIGSLTNEKLLKREQAQVAYEILGMQQHDFELLAPDTRDVFFNGATALVSSLRITVFASLVDKRLGGRDGWRRERGSNDLRDVAIRSSSSTDATTHHIVPVIASKQDTFVYKRATESLTDSPRSAGPRGRRFIVVPPTFAGRQDAQLLSVEPGSEIADDIWSVTLYALLRWLDT
jgi:multisubunit Na+/H+ antiporter MnhE subunit